MIINLKKISITTIATTLTVSALTLCQSMGATPEVDAKRDSFLQSMGFENISAQIAKTLETKTEFSGPLSKEILEKSKARYEILNLARSLAIEIYDGYEARMEATQDPKEKPGINAELIKLIGKLIEISPQPVDGSLPFNLRDRSVRLSPKGGDNLVKRANYVTSVLMQDIYTQVEDLAYDIMRVEFGAEKLSQALSPNSLLLESSRKTFEAAAQTHKKIGDYIESINTDSAIGFSKYLGSAISLLVVKEARASKSGLEKQLAAYLLRSDIILGNLISDEIKIKNNAGKIQSLKVEDGAIVAQYATGRVNQEFVKLATLDNGKKINENGFWSRMGTIWDTFVAGKAVQSKVTKISADESMAQVTTRQDYEQEQSDMDPENNQGYAHAGMAFVYKDKDSGLARVEVRDVFPDRTYGGVRKMGIEAFAMAGPNFRMAVANIDSVKFSNLVVIPLANSLHGRLPAPKELKQVEIKTDGSFAESNMFGQVASLVTAKEIKQLATIAQGLPKQVYGRMTPRLRKIWDQFLIEDGIGYGYHKTPAMGHYDDTFAISMSFFIAYGVNPHPKAASYARNYITASSNDTDSFSAINSLRQSDITTAETLMKQPIFNGIQNVEFPVMANEDRLALPFQGYSKSIFEDSPDGVDNLALKAIFASRETYYSKEKIASLSAKLNEALDTRALQAGNLVYVKDVPNAPYLAVRTPEGAAARPNPPIAKSHRSLELILKLQNGNLAQEAKDLDAFLQELGFKDLSPTLDPKSGVNEVTRRAIQVSLERQTIINTARELTKKIMLLAGPQIQSNPEMRKRFLHFVGSMMVLAPPMPTNQIPGFIKAEKDDDKRFEEVQKHLVDAAFFDTRKRQISTVSNFLHVLFTDNQAESILKNADSAEGRMLLTESIAIGKLLSTYMQRTMLDPQIGYTYWLGRALVLAVKRQSIQTGDPSLMEELKKEAALNSVEIDNYTGSQFNIRDNDAKMRTLKVKTGDYVFERSETWDSVMILVGAGPDEKKLGKLKGQGLEGQAWQIAFYKSNEDLAGGASNKDRQKKILARAEHLNQGFSHIGMAIVNEAKVNDPNGIAQTVQSTMIFDNYPYPGDHTSGGVRYLGLEHFANPIEVTSFGVANINEEKFYKEALSQNQARLNDKERIKAGTQYLPTGKDIWTSIVPNLDVNKKEEPLFIPTYYTRDKKVYWDPVITKDEYQTLMASKSSTDFMNEYRRRLVHGSEAMIARGVYFNWMNDGAGPAMNPKTRKMETVSGQNFEGGAYCSLTLLLNAYMYTGVDIEPVRGGYNSLSRSAAQFSDLFGKIIKPIETMGVKQNDELKEGDGISRTVAPYSIADQKYVAHMERTQHQVKSYTQIFEAANLQKASVENIEIAITLAKSPEYRTSMADLLQKNVLHKYELEDLGEHMLGLSAVQVAMKGGALSKRAGGKLEAKE